MIVNGQPQYQLVLQVGAGTGLRFASWQTCKQPAGWPCIALRSCLSVSAAGVAHMSRIVPL